MLFDRVFRLHRVFPVAILSLSFSLLQGIRWVFQGRLE
jgi:hypothetical protein